MHNLVKLSLTLLLLVLLIVITTNNEILLAVCAICCYIFVNLFTSCVSDRYLPQQYITMQTIKRLAY